MTASRSSVRSIAGALAALALVPVAAGCGSSTGSVVGLAATQRSALLAQLSQARQAIGAHHPQATIAALSGFEARVRTLRAQHALSSPLAAQLLAEANAALVQARSAAASSTTTTTASRTTSTPTVTSTPATPAPAPPAPAAPPGDGHGHDGHGGAPPGLAKKGDGHGGDGGGHGHD